jgi:hypothetical protein
MRQVDDEYCVTKEVVRELLEKEASRRYSGPINDILPSIIPRLEKAIWDAINQTGS